MKIKFLQDYRGVLTAEAYFKIGEVADLEHGKALIEAGRAEVFVEPAPKVDTKKVEPAESPSDPEGENYNEEQEPTEKGKKKGIFSKKPDKPNKK